jgi:hypothetical protein
MNKQALRWAAIVVSVLWAIAWPLSVPADSPVPKVPDGAAEQYQLSILAPSGQGEVQPYIHDFGSILGFVEAAFDLTTAQTGKKCGIDFVSDSGCQYPYADYFSMDGQYECTQVQGANCNISSSYLYQGYPLFDFFSLPLGQERRFTAITGAKYPPSCFQSSSEATGCFGTGNFPSAPDDE